MAMEADLRQLAERQHGLITGEQARAAGAGEDQVRSMVRQGRWIRLTPSVLALVGTPDTAEKRRLAAVLDAGRGAALSHQSAAVVWEVPGFAPGEIHVSRHREVTSRPARLSILHRPRALPEHHVVTINSIPVTTPTRTIFDLAGVISPGRLERALDTSWSRRLVSGRSLHRMLPELAERGRTGISVMRQLLAERPVDYTPMDSGTEVRAKHLLRQAGIRGFDHQVDLGDDEEWLGRVDLVDQTVRVIVEIDSALFHGALLDEAADAARTRRLESLGYVVCRVTDTLVWHRPADFVRKVRRARAKARRHASAAPASGS